MDFKYTRQELDLLKHKLFGNKSEKVSERQLLLALDILDELKESQEGLKGWISFLQNELKRS